MFIHQPFEFENIESVTSANGYRYYVAPTGEKYDSVTTVIGRKPKPELEAWKKRVGDKEANKIKVQAGQRGTNLHALMEDFINNRYNPSEHMPFAVDMFKPIKETLEKNIEVVYNQEFPLYSHRLRTAGRCDLLAKWSSLDSIVDFKTARKLKKLEWITDYFMQTACYAMMVYERIGLMVPQLVIIISVENEALPQVFVEKTSDWVKPTLEFFKEYA